MAEENQQNTSEGNISEVPPDHELFVGEIHEALSEAEGFAGETPEVLSEHEMFASEVHEVLSEAEAFAGDEDFYKFLARSTPVPTAQPPQAESGKSQPLPLPIAHKRFSTFQKVLVASIILIAAVLSYALLKSLFPTRRYYSRRPIPTKRMAPAVQQTPSSKPPAEDTAQQKTPPKIQKTEPALPTTQPLSLKVAETFYLKKDYKKAYAAYNQLRQNLPKTAEEESLRDFLQLKMALCMEKADDSDQASRLFKMVLKSRSPVIRAVANYHLSFIEIQKKQYLKARTRAYQTIALTGAVDFDKDWALLLKRDCYFLAAECLTRNVLSLCDADKDLPEDLWSSPGGQEDPFINLSEAQLRSFLNSGSDQLSKGLLGPQIQEIKHEGTLPRWSVICNGASIEELLARFASNASLDISWALEKASAPEKTKKDIVKKRPVSLYLPAATTQQFVTAAAGCVGLMARLDDKPGTPTVSIFNPANYTSLSEHLSLLTQEAISLWQRLLLTYYNSERIPNAHFALGLLQAQKGQLAEAIAEYKLIANRFSQTSLAPLALLHSSKLKANLRDYPGAREDLKQLVEQYPDTDIFDQACLHLADATMKAQLYDEAARLYRKVYNLGPSLESQTTAALGAGRCSYQRKDYQSAAKWLTRYISLVKDRTSRDLYLTYHLLGKTNIALGKLQQGCDAFQHALQGQLSKEEYVETVSALVEGHMEQENFIEALEVLENIPSWQFSKKESVEILLLNSRVFRAMGLVDKAIAAIGDRAEYISDPQLKAEISFELTNCYIAKGNLQLARSNLAEVLVSVEPGPLAHKIAFELANVCLKLNQNSQTISICRQLLDLDPTDDIRQKTLNVLATAYNRQKNYDKAALALLGQWNGADAPNEKRMFDTPTSIDQ